MMRITVECHGVLRKVCGDAVEVELQSPAATVAGVLDALAREMPELSVYLPRVACARADALVRRDEPVREGDRLALIPPVSGGRA
ncbi:MAG: MoaD/ThiS family protein [Salinisphaera sp.]|nr:MoaD/ThiS family protein [Salinisphaera sp.]